MALPPNGATWPPEQSRHIFDAYAVWSAWYANQVDGLATAYQSPGTRRGLLNRVVDWFWSPKASDGDAGVTKLHVPIASDLCQVSADLLFSEPPAFTVEDGKGEGKNVKVQERLDKITGAGLDQALVAAAEVSAALGGVYLRATWDDTLYDHVFLTKVDADGAVPTFRYGRLTAVTFWRVVSADGNVYWRHLERHDTNSLNIGVIEHGLYQGSATDLGVRVPLTENEATKHLVVDKDALISTKTPGLAVEYLPNIGPNRRWRLDPYGANLGRSDLDGIEPLMDALDRTYSNLMRDMELGKGRLVVPQYMLTDLGAGQGAAFDNDKAIFTGINATPGSASDSKLAIEAVQFKIRVEEHLAIAADLFAQIIRTAGYSSQTFGEKDAGGVEQTATEVTSKERRSYMTRDRKVRAITPGLERILFKAVEMDAALFTTGLTALPVTVAFADAVQESLESLARTAQMLHAAEAASRQTIVQMLHPDWDDIQVGEEVKRILAESPVFPDPTMFGSVVDDGSDPAGTSGLPSGNA